MTDVSTTAATVPTVEPKRRGRPPVQTKRPMVSLRMDADVLEKLRALGPGWQTRVNAVLRAEVERDRI